MAAAAGKVGARWKRGGESGRSSCVTNGSLKYPSLTHTTHLPFLFLSFSLHLHHPTTNSSPNLSPINSSRYVLQISVALKPNGDTSTQSMLARSVPRICPARGTLTVLQRLLCIFAINLFSKESISNIIAIDR